MSLYFYLLILISLGSGIALGRSFMKDNDITFYRFDKKLAATPSNCTLQW